MTLLRAGATGLVGSHVLRRRRLCPAQNIAHEMIAAALHAQPGVHAIPAEAMTQ